uniref:BTB domain-containing protein n=1 Tax=Panagrellus redivivus TaxID=6233 RepID=A0A7E4WBZ9_PANRE
MAKRMRKFSDSCTSIEDTGNAFSHVLKFIRSKTVELPNDLSILAQIVKHANDYKLKDLADLANNHIKKLTMSSPFVKLNVGGKKFTIARTTLCGTDSMLKRMIESPLETHLDDDGHILVDRDGDVFVFIVQYLRDGKVDFPEEPSIVNRIRNEAEYFGLSKLTEVCDKYAEENVFNIDACRRAVHTIPERNALIAKNETIVFLCLGGLKNSTFGTNGCQKAIASALLHFLRMSFRYPKFVYCIDYTDSTDLSFDFYNQGTRIQHVCVYSANTARLDNIGTVIDKAIQKVLNHILEHAGIGRFVESNVQLSIDL